MNINFVAPINFTSYGLTSVNILHQLTLLGHRVSLFPIGRPECYIKFEQSVIKSLNNAETFSVNAPCIRLFHQFDLALFVGKHVHIGFPIFELDTFTEKEKHHLRSCDCLYVCSEWAKNVVENNINPFELTAQYQHPTTVRVVPLGVDTSIFTPKKSTRKPTIFLNVGKWEVRKGHDILVDIFNYAFTEDDNVELWMMCDNPFYTPEKQQKFVDLYRNSKLGHKIRFIPRVESDLDVANIMQQADCGVFPSRAEGWCFHPSTKILTNGGIKNISNITDKDSIINHIGGIENVERLLYREYNGRLLEIKTIGSPKVLITPEHEVLSIINPYKERKTFKKHLNNYEPKFRKICDLKVGDFLLIPKIKNKTNELIKDNIKIAVNSDIMRLFGYYISEGSANKSAITFSFHKEETTYHNDVIKIIEQYFGEHTNIEYYDKNKANIIYCCSWLSKMLKDLFGGNARNKHIPFEFMFFDNELIKELLIGLFRGDGTCSENRYFRLSTTSETLAWQVKYLLIKLGIKATLHSSNVKLEYSIGFNGEDRYKLNFDNINIKEYKPNNQTIMINDYMLTPIRSIKEIEYCGPVYNLEVSGEHTYCISGFAVHNCIPALEMMACGKHVIITNYSAHTEFCTQDNALLVPIYDLEPAFDGEWFFRQGNWAKIGDVEKQLFARHMVKIHDMKQSGILGLNEGGIETARKFTWENTAKTIIKHLGG